MKYIEKSRIANSKKIKRSEILIDGIFILGIIMQMLGLMMVESHTLIGGIVMITGTAMVAFAGHYFEENEKYEY